LQANLLPNLQEEIHWRVSVTSLRCCTVQCNALDLLCIRQKRICSSPHHH